jgi:adenylate kinase family enzyme
MIHRIHILGASGSGTTTLGRMLAERLQYPHFDTDDYFWVPTDPPFTHQRERAERQRLLMDDVTAHNSWVVSGSLCGWGDVAMPLFELIGFLAIPQDIRMARLRQREHERFEERTLPGGDMYELSQAFLAWAASYDEGGWISGVDSCMTNGSVPCQVPSSALKGSTPLRSNWLCWWRRYSGNWVVPCLPHLGTWLNVCPRG